MVIRKHWKQQWQQPRIYNENATILGYFAAVNNVIHFWTSSTLNIVLGTQYYGLLGLAWLRSTQWGVSSVPNISVLFWGQAAGLWVRGKRPPLFRVTRMQGCEGLGEHLLQCPCLYSLGKLMFREEVARPRPDTVAESGLWARAVT